MSIVSTRRLQAAWILVLLLAPSALAAQEPAAWGESPYFGTFSIVAVDPETGESGVAVTTRNECVGNAVPHVRTGVGAVATQASTRIEYGDELLDMLEAETAPADALRRAVGADERSSRRQVGVIALDGRSAQHTGSGASSWAGQRKGPNYATQGNVLVGAEVLDTVAATFEHSSGSGRALADRLIEALAAGQAVGGDRRHGQLQSAAVLVGDPRPGRSSRPDGVTVDVNVCEHPTPVAELRRVYANISQTLGYRTIQRFEGRDVWQLKIMLHALGYFRPAVEELERGELAFVYTPDAVRAVEAFRADQGLATAERGSPAGLVDRETVALLWAELERAGVVERIRQRVRDITQTRR